MTTAENGNHGLPVEVEAGQGFVEAEFKKKICLLGDGGVGKTSLIRRFVVDEFRDKYISTMGVKVMKKNVTLKKPDHTVTLMIWDVMGQQIFRPIFKRYFKGSDGVLIVCDVTRRETMEHVPDWFRTITEVTGHIPAICLANKIDLIGDMRFTFDELNAATSEFVAAPLHTSAKTGVGVHEAFVTLTEFMMK